MPALVMQRLLNGPMKINVLWVSAQASLVLAAMGQMKHKSMQSFVRLWMSGRTLKRYEKPLVRRSRVYRHQYLR